MSRFHLPSWLARKQSPMTLIWSLLGMLAVAIAISSLAYAVISPILRGNEKKTEVAQLQQLVAKTQREHDRLQKRKRYLTSAEGVSDKAHAMGMVRPGEDIVRFTPEQSATPTPSTSAKDDADARVGGLLLAGLLLFALAFLIGAGLLFHRWRRLRAQRPAGALTPRSELRKRKRPLHQPAHER